jgi:hypothetical protein
MRSITSPGLCTLVSLLFLNYALLANKPVIPHPAKSSPVFHAKKPVSPSPRRSSTSASGIQNGPQDAPAATGPTGDNDDFSNQCTTVPSGLTVGSSFDPQLVSFTNTVKNTGTTAVDIVLLPTAPANLTSLPNNTAVTIQYDGAASATYFYSGGQFSFVSGFGIAGGNPIGPVNPVQIPGVGVNTSANYTVTIDLPNGTPLSTNPGVGRGFPVQIVAFVDANSNGQPDDTQVNYTIDRVYTGFLQLTKQTRIVQGTGVAVTGGNSVLSSASKEAAAGNLIEYVVQLVNISEPNPSANDANKLLVADGGLIVENGSTSPNNWAQDNDGNSMPDTRHQPGSAIASNGTLAFRSGNPPATPATNATSGTTAATDVTSYSNVITSLLNPGETATFTFQRKVNLTTIASKTLINGAAVTYRQLGEPTNIPGIGTTVTVTVTDTPEPTPPPQPSCEGKFPGLLLLGQGNLSCTTPTLTLTALGGITYQFSGPGVVSQTDGRERVMLGNYAIFRTPIPTVGQAVVNKLGQYTVLVTGADGCTATAQILVTGTECR